VIRVALAGLGLIGHERMLAVEALRSKGRPITISAVMDPDPARLAEVVDRTGARPAADLNELLATAPDWVIVATPHDTAVELAPAALAGAGKVLVEKPLGRTLAETEHLNRLASPGQLWVGLNYRFFAGIAALIHDVHRGRFGRPIALEGVVGHGGAPGMDKSWKLDPVRAGGGALIDPGIHLLDLSLLLAGEPLEVRGGATWSGFWNTGVEEECQLLLGGQRLPMVDLQISIVRWRSTFRVAFHGEDGYGIVEGRSRSYGPQIYRRGKRWGWQQASSQADSEERVLQSSGDDVFTKELEALVFGSEDGLITPCSGTDALASMRLLNACQASLGLPAC
jgi:predicted dehydrogenase